MPNILTDPIRRSPTSTPGLLRLFSSSVCLVPVQLTGHTNMSNSEPQATILPQAFQTMTAQDPSWNMDTGASSHLADNTGKHAKLLFNNPESSVHSVFEIIHSSPILSESGIKYYVIFLDHFSHFVWVYPLHKKSDLFDNFVAFRAYVNKQFHVDIKALQCDHGGEYDNTRFHDLFRQNGIQFRFSCPRTSQQNGKSERMIRTINNLIRTLLFQPHIPPSYRVKALNMVARLLNILPSTAINNEIPFTKLYNQTPTYEHLRVFGCLCYPHVDASHKLEPRSTPCIFLGYPANHRGYRCLDLASNKIIISRHVRFDEDVFPFGNVTPSNTPTYDFLLPHIQTTTNVPTTEPFVQHMNEPNTPITPHHITPPTSPPQPDTYPSYSSTPIPPQPDTPPSHSSTPIPTSAPTQSHAQTVDSHTPIPINNSSQTMSTHPMVTRAKAGIFKPLEHMNCHVTTTSPLPRSHVHALRDPHWKEAMYKARLVANGRSQQQGIDCDETFSPRSLYGLKQAPRAWFQRFTSYATRVGFQHSKTDSSLFVFHRGSDIAYLLLYVDDIILTTSSLAFLQRIITSLHSEFAITDHYFPPYSYALERAHMQHYNPCKTPVDTESKIGPEGDPVFDPTLYRSLAGALWYLTFMCPDLSYVVQQLHVSSLTQLVAYTDADWAGCSVTHWSTSGYCVFLRDNLLSWSAKRHVTLSRFIAEAEYRGVANVVAETDWIRNLLRELHKSLFTATLVYCDNVSAVYLSTNPIQHQCTKHIEIDIHFVRDYVASGQVGVLHVPPPKITPATQGIQSPSRTWLQVVNQRWARHFNNLIVSSFFEYLHYELPEDVVSIIFGIILELQHDDSSNLVNIMTNTSQLHVLSLQQHRNSNIEGPFTLNGSLQPIKDDSQDV
ncbi:ribonuclease H-like domain-containing protein [Tanacetum coccineum]